MLSLPTMERNKVMGNDVIVAGLDSGRSNRSARSASKKKSSYQLMNDTDESSVEGQEKKALKDTNFQDKRIYTQKEKIEEKRKKELAIRKK